MMLWIVLAAEITAVVPENPARWFSAIDTPPYLVQAGPGLWRVPIRITVGPDGKSQSCAVEASSDIPRLDALTCRLMLRRARFKPATINGVPSAGVYRTKINWLVADRPIDGLETSDADLYLDVLRLPAGLDSPARVPIKFMVDADGNTSSCTVAPFADFWPEPPAQHYPALVEIACERYLDGYKALVATDSTGKPVPSIQNALVHFSSSQTN